MIYDFLVMNRTVDELKGKIIGGMIAKIQQPSSLMVIINIKIDGESFNLLLCADPKNPRVHITEGNFSDQSPPLNFSLVMKKNISSGKIMDIDMVPLERIMKIDIKSRDEIGELRELALIVEIMGKHSNIILISKEDRRILGAVKHITSRVNRYREIVPNELYIAPPTRNKRIPDISEKLFSTLLLSSKESLLQNTLVNNFMGTGLLWAKEIITRAGLNPEKRSDEISCEELKKLYFAWNKSWKEVKEKNAVLYCFSPDKKPVWETPLAYPSELLIFKGFPVKIFSEINKALDSGYKIAEKENKIKTEKSSLSNHIREKRKKLCQIKKKLEIQLEKSEKAEEYRKKGEIILASFHMKLPENNNILEVPDIFDEEQKMINIEIDPALSLSQNAQKYFKKYKKAEKLKKTGEGETKEVEKELEYLDNVLLSIEFSENTQELEEIREELSENGIIKEKIQKNKNSEPVFMNFTSPDGWEIMVGKNNKQNDFLTMKQAKGNDIWMHVKGSPGSHVIIKNPTGVEVFNIPQRTLLMGAQLAAYHSKCRNSTQVMVDYTQRKYVKKPKGAKPGMVIYHGEKSIYVSPRP